MRLHRLRLTNFRQHAATEIEFGPGITGIIGPNGAGKSTLLEAIAWAFYGSPAARGGRDSIRFNRAPPRSPVRVEVEFALGPHEYRVVRTLYGAELYLDRGDTAVANSAQQVTTRVQRVLGMSREEFFSTYFTGQKELAVMATLGPADRGRFLSQLMGYERLRVAQERLRAQRGGLKGELQGLEMGLADPEALAQERAEAAARRDEATAAVAEAETRLGTAQRRRATEGPAWTAMVEVRERALALDGDRRVAEKEVEEARREFERLDKELADALSAQTALRELEPQVGDVEPLRGELARLDADAKAAGQRRQLTGQLAERREQLSRLAERRHALGAVAEAVAGAERAAGAGRAELAAREEEEERAHTEWVRTRQDVETKLDALREQYKDVQEHLEHVRTAGPDGECPTCRRALAEEYDTVLAALQSQLEEIELNGRFFRQRHEQLAAEPEGVVDARRRVAEARAALEAATTALAQARARAAEAAEADREHTRTRERLAELERTLAALPQQYDGERHDAVRDLLRAREPLVARVAAQRVKAARAEQLVREAEAAERSLSSREARFAALSGQIAELGFDEARYAAARSAYEAAEQAVRDAEITVHTRRADAKAAEAALQAVAKRITERDARAGRADAVRVELRTHEALDEALGDLRGELNAQLRPELAEVASRFMSDLTDGRYHDLELDEQYRVLLLEEGEPKPVISGGEEDVANLVLRLAISQLVAERAGQPLSLLVLDEIFGSLDERRREHVVALLRRLADRFPQVILITHIESVRDSVDRVLRVAVDAGSGAAIVQEAPGDVDEDVAA